ncbi:NAD-dependent deacetylase sirtuin-6 [Elysia marginata]|uniref:protein acetyllysine N-acetyltransferase n=1 Tax=Elysia marginata TaxID=1093978 RepID=A0AAV4FXV9_9GAST|nr:NAD-dependent deacetylase sirtuin-6 [Elysia marginata]
MKCCLKTCPYGVLDFDHRRVEVKSAIPKGGIHKFRDCFSVNWKNNGEAMFHQECWERLVFASRRRKGSKKFKSHLDFLTIQMECEREMIINANETAEMFDANTSVSQAAAEIAELIKSAQHCVVFTETKFDSMTWKHPSSPVTKKFKVQRFTAKMMTTVFWDHALQHFTTGDSTSSSGRESPEVVKEADENDLDETEVEYEALRPTYTHEAIQWLVEANYIKYVVSQNCDGLHVLSGIPPSKISELHGNVFVECCEKCGKRYVRPFYVCDDVADIYLEELEDYGKTDVIPPKFMLKCKKCELSHRTGRICEKKGCKGYLKDTIINFNDNLEEAILDSAFTSAKDCDLMICLGTTLTVNPAAGIVDLIKRPHRVVICNRQATERDGMCHKKDKDGHELGVRVYADCDVLMKQVMSCLLEKDITDFESSILSKKKKYDALRISS